MAIMAVVALVLGVCYGLLDMEVFIIDFLSNCANYVLYALMLFVGVSVGLQRGLVQKIKEEHIKILIVPAITIVASVLGGYLCSFITGYPVAVSTVIGGSMGWYSLSGIAIGEIAGAEYGSVAFLSCLMREIFAFVLIPLMARHLNYYSCVSAAGATSEDTTLPMLIRHADEHIVVLAVVNGMICSTFVPILISVLL